MLARDLQPLPARDQNSEVRTDPHQVRDLSGRVDHMLEVVQQEEQSLISDLGRKVSLRAEYLSGRRHHQRRIRQRCQGNPPDAVWVEVADGRCGLQR